EGKTVNRATDQARYDVINRPEDRHLHPAEQVQVPMAQHDLVTMGPVTDELPQIRDHAHDHAPGKSDDTVDHAGIDEPQGVLPVFGFPRMMPFLAHCSPSVGRGSRTSSNRSLHDSGAHIFSMRSIKAESPGGGPGATADPGSARNSERNTEIRRRSSSGR